MVEQWAFTFDGGVDELLYGFLSQLRVLVQVADDFPSEHPEIVDMLADRFLRQGGSGEVEQQRAEIVDNPLAGR